MTDVPPYDPEARRDTPLALKLKARIRAEGPMAAAYFFGDCLGDPEFGYYRTQRAIGKTGDFITAPEISQIFGELIGAWSVVAWQQMGSPPSVTLMEFGPGRGTLMADVLRAAQRSEDFYRAVNVQMVEINDTLASQQKAALAAHGNKVAWADPASGLAGPTIVIANEFLDTEIGWHFIKMESGWGFLRVGLDQDDRLTFVPSDYHDQGNYPDQTWPDAPVGSSRVRPDYSIFHALARTWRMGDWPPIAMLFIDYGGAGKNAIDTIQAVRNHRFEHPLTSPGEADISEAVDFFEAKACAEARGFATDGPITQAEFLGNLGIMQRASKLMAANPAKANDIETGVARLMAPNGMGTRFKVLGVRSKSLPPLPGFPAIAEPPR